MKALKSALSEALTDFYIDSIPESDKHIFSDAFNKKMGKLLKTKRKPYYRWVNTAGKRIAIIIIAVFIAGTATALSVEAIRKKVFGFFIEIFEKYSIIQHDGEESAPESIEDIYEITCDLVEYTVLYEEITASFINRIYVKDKVEIDYSQWVKGEYKQNWNTEDAEIEHIEINGYKAIIFTDNHHYNHIIWENHEYIFTLSTNMDKNSLIRIAEFVRKAE